MRRKNILIYALLLCFFFASASQKVSAVNYQTEINRYLNAVKQNINQKTNWQKGFSLAQKNIESLELCLHNMQADTQWQQKNIKILLYNPIQEKMDSLIKSGDKVAAYMKELQNNYAEMNKANYENKMRVLSNIGKSMTKWSLRIGEPDITDLDISEEKKDAQMLTKDINGINDIPQMMNYNRKEYGRMSVVLHKIMDMLTQLEPMNKRLNEVIKKYSGKNAPETGKASGTFYGRFTGSVVSGTLQFTITGSKVKGAWAADTINNPQIQEASGEIWGEYGYFDGKDKPRVVSAQLTGFYRVKSAKTGVVMSHTVHGELKGETSEYRSAGTWNHGFLNQKAVPVIFDSGAYEASK